MMLKIAIVFVVVIAAILLFAATKPDRFTVHRSITIDAPPEKIFELINDFHNWPKWAPQDREDAAMKRTFSGAVNGEGASSEWSGTGNTGRGSMVLTQSQPPGKISVQVDWLKPFATHNVNDFVLEGVGASTKVTWSMRGPNLFMMKVMGVFVNMDRMMGKHFEAGLKNLKEVAERGK
jgi:uncharacterized protein YndB with AHSA1/START domain